jgi:putative transcriptional regulator
MFNKSFLVNKLVNSLLSKQFQVLLSEGCFNIVAKKEELLLIKSLINVDSLNEEQALSLRSISFFLSAYPLVVSVKTNREFLNDETIYSRFQLPVLTPTLFDNFLEEESIPSIQSSKGKHTVTINTEELKEKRKQLGFSLQELSQLIGISKKALYEIENKRVNPTQETVKKLETFLKIDLKKPYKLQQAEKTYLKPKNEFQQEVSKEFKRIGIDNSAVYSAPFEIVGKEKFSLITTLSKNGFKIKKEATKVKKLSSIFSSKAVFVAKASREESVEGVPVVLESELPEIETTKEFDKILKEKKE